MAGQKYFGLSILDFLDFENMSGKYVLLEDPWIPKNMPRKHYR
jgi:hypothetical protein